MDNSINIFLFVQKINDVGNIIKEKNFQLNLPNEATGELLLNHACERLHWDIAQVRVVNFRKENKLFNEIEDILTSLSEYQVEDMNKYMLQVFVNEENGIQESNEIGQIVTNFNCIICYEESLTNLGVCCQQTGSLENTEPEKHMFCMQCVVSYVEKNVSDMALSSTYDGIRCFAVNCPRSISYASFYQSTQENIRMAFEARMQQENLASIGGLERCKNCNYAMEINVHPQILPFFSCPREECKAEFCRLCKVDSFPDHIGKECDEITQNNDNNQNDIHDFENEMSEVRIRRCAKCEIPFIKEDGCNFMTCRCKSTMCYLCQKSNISHSHFDKGRCKDKLFDNANKIDKKKIKEIRQRMEETGIGQERERKRVKSNRSSSSSLSSDSSSRSNSTRSSRSRSSNSASSSSSSSSSSHSSNSSISSSSNSSGSISNSSSGSSSSSSSSSSSHSSNSSISSSSNSSGSISNSSTSSSSTSTSSSSSSKVHHNTDTTCRLS